MQILKDTGEALTELEETPTGEVNPMMAISAVPGYGMTQPKGQWAWENPPKYTDPELAFESVMQQFTSDDHRTNILKLMLAGVSIEEIINTTMFNGFAEGKFTPDVAELVKPALAVLLIDIAREENIPFKIFTDPIEDTEISDREMFSIMQERNPEMFAGMKENLNSLIRQGKNPAPQEQPVAPANFLEMGGV